MNLTWWEYEELIEHFRSRNDIWLQSDENPLLWLRSQEQESCCAFQFTAPADSSQEFRLYRLTVHSIGWSEERSKLYVERLLMHWTSFAHRERVEIFLRTEVGIDAEVAALSAIAISSFDYVERPKDPEDDFTSPMQEILPDTFSVPNYTPLHDTNAIGVWYLQNGGFISLRLEGGMIHAKVSIAQAHGQGYDPHGLSGYLRPRSSTAEQFAAGIAGWTTAEAATREATAAEERDRRLLISLLEDEERLHGDAGSTEGGTEGSARTPLESQVDGAEDFHALRGDGEQDPRLGSGESLPQDGALQPSKSGGNGEGI